MLHKLSLFEIVLYINFVNIIFQELVSWVNNSDADFVILGGDFNTDPRDKETSYHNLKTAMVSSMEELFLNIKVQWILILVLVFNN